MNTSPHLNQTKQKRAEHRQRRRGGVGRPWKTSAEGGVAEGNRCGGETGRCGWRLGMVLDFSLPARALTARTACSPADTATPPSHSFAPPPHCSWLRCPRWPHTPLHVINQHECNPTPSLPFLPAQGKWSEDLGCYLVTCDEDGGVAVWEAGNTGEQRGGRGRRRRERGREEKRRGEEEHRGEPGGKQGRGGGETWLEAAGRLGGGEAGRGRAGQGRAGPG